MPGLGPDMSALNLLSQANLSSVLNKVYYYTLYSELIQYALKIEICLDSW